jgi:hypothetical protein
VRPTLRLLLPALALLGADVLAQDPSAPARRRGPLSVVRPVLEGALGGAVLAFGYVNSGGDGGWLMRDESAVRAGVGAGVVAALGVWAASLRVPDGAAERPRLQVAVGGSSEGAQDVSLGVRAPVRGRLSLEGAVLIRNTSAERVEEQTRCGGFFGCVTADYLVDWRHEQSIAGLVRAQYRLPSAGRLTPVLSLGAGRAWTHLATTAVADARRDDALVEGGLGLAYGRVSRWTLDAAARGPVSRGRTGATRGPELSLRVGRAFGYR